MSLVSVGTGDTNKARGGLWVHPESVVFVRGYDPQEPLLTEIGLKTGVVLTCTLEANQVARILNNATVAR